MEIRKHRLVAPSRRRLRLVAVVLGVVVGTAGLAPTAAYADVIPCDDDDLIEAIEAANGDPADNVITLEEDCTYVLDEPYEDTDNGLPVITEGLEIRGNDATIKRDPGADSFRIFEVDASGPVVFEDLTVRGGRQDDPSDGAVVAGGILNLSELTLDHVKVLKNRASCSGTCAALAGGIFNEGPLTLMGSTVADNRASCVGCDFPGALGGGILTQAGATLENSVVTRNNASCTSLLGADFGICEASGGGVALIDVGFPDAIVTLTDSLVSYNSASCDGSQCGAQAGGMYNDGQLTVEGSSVRGNAASCRHSLACLAQGGGILSLSDPFCEEECVDENTLEISESRVERNIAECGDSPNCSVHGGGVVSFTEGATITDSKVRRNKAVCDADPCDARGGGLVLGATTTIEGSGITANAVEAPDEDGGVAQGGGLAVIWAEPDFGAFDPTVVTLTGSDVTDNEAEGEIAEGGGIWVDLGAGASVVLEDGSDVEDNSPDDCFPEVVCE